MSHRDRLIDIVMDSPFTVDPYAEAENIADAILAEFYVLGRHAPE